MKATTNLFNQFAFALAVKNKMLAEMVEKDKRLPFEHFSKETRVSKATLSRIQNGTLPDVETFCKLLKWLDRPASDFFNNKK